jgi:hypothetical protein
MYEELIQKLNSSDPNNRMYAAEYIRDLYDDRFQYSHPDSWLVELFVDGLIHPILSETNEDIQYAMLDALYVWSEFPHKNNTNTILAQHIERLLSVRNIGYALWTLMTSKKREFVKQYEQFLYHKNPFIREVAKQGVRSVN